MICGLFGSMHFGSFIGYVIDNRSKRKMMEQLLEPGSVGFLPMGAEGAWTWLLEQVRLLAPVFRSDYTVVPRLTKVKNHPPFGCKMKLFRIPEHCCATAGRAQ